MGAYLIDTHVFIWLDSEPRRLSTRTIDIIENPSNDILLSTASIWEMQIKSHLGKLTFNIPLAEMVGAQIKGNRIGILDIGLKHVLELANLPPHHGDPFDRMLIAQARAESLVMVSHDAVFRRYPVETIW